MTTESRYKTDPVYRAKRQAYQAARYKRHREKILARQRELRCLNIDDRRAKQAAYKRKNRDVILAQRRDRHARNVPRQLWLNAKERVKDRPGLPFDITPDDIIVPTHCPVLGVELRQGVGGPSPYAPSLDRIIPAKGYVKGNVVVVSRRANTIKNDATLEELEALVHFYRGLIQTIKETDENGSRGHRD